MTWLDFCSALDRKPNRQPRCHSGRQSLTSRRTPSTSPLGVKDVTRAPWGQWKVSERPRGITLGDAPRARHRRRPIASRRRPPRPSTTTPHRPPYHVDVSRRRRPAEARGTYRSRASAYPRPLPRALPQAPTRVTMLTRRISLSVTSAQLVRPIAPVRLPARFAPRPRA